MTRLLLGGGAVAFAALMLGGEAATLTRSDPPAAAGAVSPSLTATGSGFLLSWIEPAGAPGRGEENALRYASFKMGKWTEAQTVASGSEVLAARPPVMVEGTRERLLVAWTAKSGRGVDAPAIELAHAEAGGPWRRLASPHADRFGNEHDLPALVSDGDGFRVFWLDGKYGDMKLRSALVESRSERVELLDGRVCDCCSLSAAATSAGPVVVYRGRSAEEIRDISILRRPGKAWTKPATVAADGWKIAGCPVNGPAVAAIGQAVAVAWFTAAADHPRVEAAFSRDAGASFSKPIVVDDATPLGHVGIALDGGGDGIVSWLAGGASPSVRLRRVRPGGPSRASVVVAETKGGRSTGSPVLARSGGILMVAWVESGTARHIRAATISVKAVP